MARRREQVLQLFPASVVVEEEDPETIAPDLGELYPQEAAAIARAVAKRRREFIAGRRCARRALEALGHRPGPMPPNPDRSPPWPPGFVGSITHTHGGTPERRWAWCGAVVTRRDRLRAVGLDAEPEEAVGEEIFDRILGGTERRWLAGQPAVDQGVLARMVFSAKEAFYKAQYLESGAYLGFHEVELDLEALGRHGGEFRARLLNPAGDRFSPGDSLPGRVAVLDGLIVSVAWLA